MMELMEQVRDRIAGVPGIGVLAVFGSRARGRARPDSDLDVAVLPLTGPDRGDEQRFRLGLQKAVAAALSDLAPGGRVDVVYLDEAQDTLRQRVMEQGSVVLCRDPETWKALRVRTMREYGDREPWRRIYRRKLRQRLVEGRRSGRSARARKLLERLESYRARLESFQRFSEDEFLLDEDLHQLAARYLQLVCEHIIDLSQHVLSDEGFRQPRDYKDAIEVLREEGILEDDLAERLKGWMGFRNVLVHLYLDTDHGRSYQTIQDELEDLDAFAARMARFLDG